jgi:chemosensory pili system protein ChpA (sensor histidine kinase/response regulator)
VTVAVAPAAESQPDDGASQDGHRAEAEVKKDAEPRAMDESAVIRVSRDRLERLLNLVGELVISRGRLEQRLMALEQLSNQLLTFKGRMLESVRTFEEKHAFTLPASSPSQTTMTSQGVPSASQIQNLADFGVLEFDRYDDFNILARRLTEVSADVGESMAQLNASIRKAREDMGQLQHLSLGMRDEIARARMVPIGTPFVRFRRSVREMAKLTGKQVALVTSGEHTEVDTGVVERLVDPLIHLVRNAVYHGIEPAAVRVARGKPSTGSVYLNAAHRGNAVVIEVEDDGAGIDLSKVKTKAAALGLIRPESVATMSDADAIKMIFLPGFSTADQVGDVAGRGVGMDVVKQTLESINGQIEVETEPGVGTKFTLRLPLTLLISTALLVRVGHERYALPLPNIREVVMPAPGGVQEVGGRPVLQVGDEAVEVHTLAHLLGSDRAAPSGPCPVVIIRSATGVHGLEVDELLGRQEIVIKALGALKPFQESSFVGATIDPEGRVILVLDISKLLSGRAPDSIELPSPATVPLLPDQTGSAAEGDGGTAGHNVRILLIDDSLSIRKFVGKMLQGAGYEVDTAIDGEEGLRKAATGVYRLIITDLEMPKLNGYEVIQALRDRPQTKSTPILVMTTRAGEKHRQMALSVGASGYIAKPVEERALTLEVSRWTGHAVSMSS